jgi:hypothetical protein
MDACSCFACIAAVAGGMMLLSLIGDLVANWWRRE